MEDQASNITEYNCHEILGNASSTNLCTIYNILFTSLNCVGLTMNVFALSILVSVKYKKPALVVLTSLAVSDLAAPVFDIIYIWGFNVDCLTAKVNATLPRSSHFYFVLVSMCVGDVMQYSTFFVSITITLDRLVAVTKPLEYAHVVTKVRAFIAVTIVWSLAFVFGFAPLFLNLGYPVTTRWFFLFFDNVWVVRVYHVVHGFMLLFFAILIAIYVFMFRKIRIHQRLLSRGSMKTAVTSLLITSSFAICYIPVTILIMTIPRDVQRLFDNRALKIGALVCGIGYRLNPVIDPILYVSRSRRFYSRLREILLYVKSCGTSEGKNSQVASTTMSSQF